MKIPTLLIFSIGLLLSVSGTTLADVVVNTGTPDGLLGAFSTQGSPGLETETADDFILNSPTAITGGSFFGLIPSRSTISQVTIEIYRVFPKDSNDPPSGNVLTRMNSPSDVEFADRASSVPGDLSFSTSVISPSFTVGNSVVNGIQKFPNQKTGGEGAKTGQEIRFDVTFTNPFSLPADHYFFVPQVQLSDGTFLWLSAPKPIVAPGTPFLGDLQAWIRNENLAPDWSRIGTDIIGPPTGGGAAPTFNMAFSLDGNVIPEPSALPVMLLGALAIAAWKIRSRG